jgi:hypothetical protein
MSYVSLPTVKCNVIYAMTKTHIVRCNGWNDKVYLTHVSWVVWPFVWKKPQSLVGNVLHWLLINKLLLVLIFKPKSWFDVCGKIIKW